MLQHPYEYQGDVIANSTPYAQLPTYTPMRVRVSFFGSQVTHFVRDPPCHFKTPTWMSTRRSTSKGGTGNKLPIVLLEESHKEYTKRLCKQTPLWLIVRSRGLRNPQVQDDRKKRDIEQSALTHAHHTHCASSQLGTTADQSMRFLGTDFEKRAIWQGSVEEPATKDFVARKVRTIDWNKCQESAGTGSGPKSAWEVVRQLSLVKQQSTFIYKFQNPLGILVLGCTALT
jgi:hypothetical protein